MCVSVFVYMCMCVSLSVYSVCVYTYASICDPDPPSHFFVDQLGVSKHIPWSGFQFFGAEAQPALVAVVAQNHDLKKQTTSLFRDGSPNKASPGTVPALAFAHFFTIIISSSCHCNNTCHMFSGTWHMPLSVHCSVTHPIPTDSTS